MSSSYFPVLLWSLVILLSFYGYGEALRRALGRKDFDDLGWGLTCAWGMALTICAGGWLMLFAVATKGVLAGTVLLGALFGLFFVMQRLVESRSTTSLPSRKDKRRAKESPYAALNTEPLLLKWLNVALSAAIWILAALALISSIAWPFQVDPNDDLTGYLVYPQQILQSGTLIEPFSFQRAGTFGGQALMQALVMIFGGERNGHVPDRGFAMLLLAALFLYQLRSVNGWRRTLGLTAILFFLLSPVPRISTHGAMLGGAFVVAGVLTIQQMRTGAIFRSALPAAMLLAGAATIRPTFLLLITLWAVGAIVVEIVQARTANQRKEVLARYCLVGALAICLLAPFSLLLWHSNGTPVIPPFSGFVDAQYQIHSYEDLRRDLASVGRFVFSLGALPFFCLAAVAFVFTGSLTDRVLVSAAALSSLVVLYKFSAQSYVDMFRFVYPLLVPATLYVFCKAVASPTTGATKPWSAYRPLVLSTSFYAVFLLWIATSNANALGELRAQLATLPAQFSETRGFFVPAVKSSYEELQSKVPPGTPLLSVADASYLFDFRRNPVYSINVIGGSAPPPGIPFNQGSDALRQYFLRSGINYMICVDFDNAVLLYTRRLWTTDTRPERFYQVTWKPRFSDFMKNVDQLDKEGFVIERAGNVRLFRFDVHR